MVRWEAPRSLAAVRPTLLVRLTEAKQEMQVHSMYIREAEMRLAYARGRFNAVRGLVAYWQNPTEDALREGVRMVMYDCEDWRDLLVDADIDCATVSEVVRQANDRLKAGEPLLETEQDTKDQLVRLVTEGLLYWFKGNLGLGNGQHQATA